ncbi:MAG: DUF6076 domain-containing protein [Coprococcus sp.]
MENVNVRGYMHIYIGVFDNIITFGDSLEKMSLGEALLRFIYADLKSLDNRAHYSIEEFRSVHPYFIYCDSGWQKSFIDNLKHPQDIIGIPQLNGLIELQAQYASLLLELYNHSGGYDEQHLTEVLEAREWFQNSDCFSRISVNIRKTEDSSLCLEDFFVSSLEECLFIEFIELLKRRIIIKTCKNCGRLFIPKRSNMDYCPRIYSPDGKTCSEVGYTQTFARNVKNDELLLAYTRAYKAHYARMTKPRKKAANMTREEFDAWYQEAKRRLEQARAGLLDPETFKAWLKE